MPLGSLVDTKIKERIWSNQYIDLGLLISEAAHETTYLSSTLSFEQNTTHRIKSINSIEQWCDAFLIFMAIYTEHCPSDFTYGFPLSFQGDLSHRAIPCNHPSLLDNMSVARDMINQNCNIGRIAGPFPLLPIPNLVISPLGLIPKAEHRKCCINHDLSFPKGNSVIFGIPKEFCSVTYKDYDYFVSLLTSVGQGCFIAKADIESVFRIIPVHPNDYHLLVFSFDRQYYYDRCLPTGCSISCKIFEQLQTTCHIMHMSHILDDYIFLSVALHFLFAAVFLSGRVVVHSH